MTTNHKEMLTKVLCDVLENFAFMFGDLVDEVPEYPGDVLRATMRFIGPFQGGLSLAVPREICPQIAANVIGLEPDDEKVNTHAEDAIKELLNVTCGQVLTTMAGVEPVFDLTVPVIDPVDEGGWSDMIEAPNTVIVLVDDFPMILHLDVE